MLVALLCCLLACAATSAAPFSFDDDLGGWHVRANETELVLTWLATGVAWRSPLLSVGTSKRQAHTNTGCWSHKVFHEKTGQNAVLHSATVTKGNTIHLFGKVAMVAGSEENWTLQLVAPSPGVLSYAIHIDNSKQQGNATPVADAYGLYKYNSFEVSLLWAIVPTERILGGGEQYSTADLNGQQFQLWSGEQGIGRGLQPISDVIDTGCPPCAGNKYTSYSFVPVLLSSLGYGVVSENLQLTTVDLRSDVASMKISFEDHGDASGLDMSGHILGGKDIRSLLPPLTTLTGRMSAPPAWMLEGLIIGTEGGHEVVSKQLDLLLAAKVPVAGVWIQDWSGMLVDKLGKFVWWNWQLDEDRYPKDWFRNLTKAGIKVLTYVNTFLTNSNRTDGKVANLFYEAERLGHLLLGKDGKTLLQKVQFADFHYGMVNLFKEDSRDWWAKTIRCNVMMACDDGVPLVYSWMHDYAEYLPFAAEISSEEGQGKRFGSDVHNEYPRLHSAAARVATEGFPDVSFFARSGDLHSPGTSKMFWLGDQLTSWDACDGMQSALIGAMSGGVSGWTMNHVDIGGFTMIDRLKVIPLPGIHYKRDADMLVRWMELGVFMNAIFRTHEGLIPAISSQPWDPDMLNTTRSLTELFVRLGPYRAKLVKDAEDLGLPPVRHGMLVYPEDPTWFNVTDRKMLHRRCSAGDEIGLSQFFFGDDVLVAPMLHEKLDQLSVYLPKGTWVHMWTKRTAVGPSYDKWDAPAGFPAVFFRNSSTWRDFFIKVGEEHVRATGASPVTVVV